MSQPPPFLLPERRWSRVSAMLAGAGRQRVAVALLALAALLVAGLVWIRATPGLAGADDPGGGGEAGAAALTDPSTGQDAAAGLAASGPGQTLPRAAPDTSAGSSGPTDRVAVHVAGHVRHPGLIRLPAGSRVQDAIRAAGGATSGADLDAVNLARKLTDGEQVLIPGPGDPPRPLPPDAGAAPGTPTAPLDLNTATVEQLDTLPGVGEVTAGRIAAYRSAHPQRRATCRGPLWFCAGVGEQAGQVAAAAHEVAVPHRGLAQHSLQPRQCGRRRSRISAQSVRLSVSDSSGSF